MYIMRTGAAGDGESLEMTNIDMREAIIERAVSPVSKDSSNFCPISRLPMVCGERLRVVRGRNMGEMGCCYVYSVNRGAGFDWATAGAPFRKTAPFVYTVQEKAQMVCFGFLFPTESMASHEMKSKLLAAVAAATTAADGCTTPQ